MKVLIIEDDQGLRQGRKGYGGACYRQAYSKDPKEDRSPDIF